MYEIIDLSHVGEPLKNPSKPEAFGSLAPVSALVRGIRFNAFYDDLFDATSGDR